jgi:hypothetical protein
VYEFIVAGNLDGVTPAPAVPIPPASGSPLSGQFVRQEIAGNLGLIDLTGGATQGGLYGAYAGRIVKWIEIVGPNAPIGPDNVAVAFNGQQQQAQLQIPPAAVGIFSRNCIFVPQTAQLQLQNLNSSPGQPILVRIAVWQPKTLHELNSMIEACCCLGKCVNGQGQPCNQRAIYTAAAAARTLTSVNPVTVARGATQAFTVQGTGFTPTDRWQIYLKLDNGKQLNIPITDTTYVTDTEFLVTAEVPTEFITSVEYSIALSPTLGPQYPTVLADAIEVT